MYKIFSAPGECLIINKAKNHQMTLIRRGEKIALKYVAPLDFDETTQSVIPKLVNVQNFIKKLKLRFMYCLGVILFIQCRFKVEQTSLDIIRRSSS